MGKKIYIKKQYKISVDVKAWNMNKLILWYFKILCNENYKELVGEFDDYELLGISKTATKDEIREAYDFLNKRIRPENIPDASPLKERYVYLLDKINNAYASVTNINAQSYIIWLEDKKTKTEDLETNSKTTKFVIKVKRVKNKYITK